MSDPAEDPKGAAPAPAPDAADLDAAAEVALAACGGDARAAVRALLVITAHQEREIARLASLISRGYARGAVPKAMSMN
jgi:hypothetical protein